MHRLVSDVAKGLLVAASFLVAMPGKASGPFLILGVPVPPPMGARSLCQEYLWACRDITGSHYRHSELIEMAYLVNSYYNERIQAADDWETYGQEEKWAVPTGGSGDCEDYALAKKETLLASGVSSDRLLMATVLDLDRNHHAVLILRTDRGDYVLDNLTDEIKHWGETGYIYLRVQLPLDKKQWRMVL